MKKQVIIVNGYPDSGKTTVSKMIAHQKPTIIHSSIKYVKEISKEYFGWNNVKTDISRKFLSDMKMFLNDKTDLIEKDLSDVYQNFINPNDSHVILLIDIREKNEISKYKEKFKAVTLLVKNPRVNTNVNNNSDAQVEDTTYDYTIYNDGTLSNLESEVNKFLRQIEVDKFQARLYLRNWDKDKFICDISSIDQAFHVMNEHIEHWGLSQPIIIRKWVNAHGEIMLDFGSYNKFFVIKNKKGLYL